MLSRLRRVARKTNAYRRWKQWEARRALRLWTAVDQARLDFYKQFLSPTDIAFDVGANMANRTRLFRMLCGHVVAVEPQRDCVEVLERSFAGDARISIVTDALGAYEGEADLHVGDAHVLSTLSAEWLSAVRSTERFAGQDWTRVQRVRVTTLDRLIERFGVPAFIKIDVEGHEDQVLAGLSTPVKALSFEFTPEHFSSALRCLDHLASLGSPVYNYGLGEEPALLLPTWVSREELLEALAPIRTSDRIFGDIYARFAPRS